MGKNIEDWRIYFVTDVRQTVPIAKDKLISIVVVTDLGRGFMVSSEIDVWTQISEQRMACQAKILASEHKCLTHDSWVNCFSLLTFWDEELTEKRDKLSKNAMVSIRQAVSNSPTIETRFKRAILP